MAQAISKLVVQMEAENAKLHKKIDQSRRRLRQFSRTTKKSLQALKDFGKIGAVAVAGVAVVLGRMTKNILESADRIGKLSVATGISTEKLSQFAFAAKLTGSNFESLVKGFTKLQRSMFDASEGLVTQKRAFDQLGISVLNNAGNLRDTNEVIGDVADAFKNMTDGAKKGALAQIIFGRAGRDMIPFLNEGKAGIAAMNKEANELGITMSGGLTKAAEQTNDNLERLSTAFQGVLLKVLAPLLPKLVEATKAMVAWAKEGDNVSAAIKKITNFGKGLLTMFYLVKGVLESVALAGASLAAGLVAAASGDFSSAMDIIKMGAEKSDKAWSDATTSVSKLWDSTAKDIKASASKTGEAIAAPVAEAEKNIKNSVGLSLLEMEKLKKKFTDALKGAQNFARNLNKEFADRANAFNGNKDEDLTTFDATLLEGQAQDLLASGDIEGAADKARAAFDVLDKIKAVGGETDSALASVAGRLQEIGEEIGKSKVANVGAKIAFDLQASIDEAAQVNQVMQDYLKKNPLIQQLFIQQEGQALQAGSVDGVGANRSITPVVEAKSSPVENLQAVNLTLPGGDVIPFYGDAHVVEQTRRDFAREALRAGRR